MINGDNLKPSQEDVGQSLPLEPESHELLQKLLELGYSQIEVWYQGNPVRGYGDVFEEIRGKYLGSIYDPAGLLKKRSGDLDKEMNEEGIYEVAVVAPLTRYSTSTRVVGIEKSWFGWKKHPVTEAYEYADGQLRMDEILAGKSTEPAAVISYRACDLKDPKKPPDFKNPRLSRGNQMVFKLALPESLARQSSTIVKSRPRFIRTLVEAFVQYRYPEGFKKAWDTYSGPPWGKWDAHHQPRILFADLLDSGKTIQKIQALNMK